MSNLRLIKESELRRGGIIGSGAFGTVYKVRKVYYLKNITTNSLEKQEREKWMKDSLFKTINMTYQ